MMHFRYNKQQFMTLGGQIFSVILSCLVITLQAGVQIIVILLQALIKLLNLLVQFFQTVS